jgi:hypothetical protein
MLLTFVTESFPLSPLRFCSDENNELKNRNQIIQNTETSSSSSSSFPLAVVVVVLRRRT